MRGAAYARWSREDGHAQLHGYNGAHPAYSSAGPSVLLQQAVNIGLDLAALFHNAEGELRPRHIAMPAG